MPIITYCTAKPTNSTVIACVTAWGPFEHDLEGSLVTTWPPNAVFFAAPERARSASWIWRVASALTRQGLKETDCARHLTSTKASLH